MTNSPEQVTRRQILKRGAIVGGSVLWVAPVVQTLGMSRALAAPVSKLCTDTTANKVVDYKPGKQWDGVTAVLPDRSVAANALGSWDGKFVSLGFRDVQADTGWIILKLQNAYFKGNSGSALVVETTINPTDYPEERANVYVSGDSFGPWILVGTASNKLSGTPPKTTIPLDSIAAVPPVVRYVKVEDATNKALHKDRADGFDLDSLGISCPAGPN